MVFNLFDGGLILGLIKGNSLATNHAFHRDDGFLAGSQTVFVKTIN